MPTGRVRMPRGMLSKQQRAAFRMAARASIATHMSCIGYDNEPLNLTPDTVHLEVDFYDPAECDVTAVIEVTVEGFDYPSRMLNIDTRTWGIASDLAPFVPGDWVQPIDDDAVPHQVTVTFLDYRRGAQQSA